MDEEEENEDGDATLFNYYFQEGDSEGMCGVATVFVFNDSDDLVQSYEL